MGRPYLLTIRGETRQRFPKLSRPELNLKGDLQSPKGVGLRPKNPREGSGFLGFRYYQWGLIFLFVSVWSIPYIPFFLMNEGSTGRFVISEFYTRIMCIYFQTMVRSKTIHQKKCRWVLFQGPIFRVPAKQRDPCEDDGCGNSPSFKKRVNTEGTEGRFGVGYYLLL